MVYRGADKSLARTGRKQATASKLWLLQATQNKIQKVVRPIRSPRQEWPPRRTKNSDFSIVFFSRVGLRTYQHLFRIIFRVRCHHVKVNSAYDKHKTRDRSSFRIWQLLSWMRSFVLISQHCIQPAEFYLEERRPLYFTNHSYDNKAV